MFLAHKDTRHPQHKADIALSASTKTMCFVPCCLLLMKASKTAPHFADRLSLHRKLSMDLRKEQCPGAPHRPNVHTNIFTQGVLVSFAL